MKKPNERIPCSASRRSAKIQHYLWQIDAVERRLLQLRAKKTELLQRIDALESQRQALKRAPRKQPSTLSGH